MPPSIPRALVSGYEVMSGCGRMFPYDPPKVEGGGLSTQEGMGDWSIPGPWRPVEGSRNRFCILQE